MEDPAVSNRAKIAGVVLILLGVFVLAFMLFGDDGEDVDTTDSTVSSAVSTTSSPSSSPSSTSATSEASATSAASATTTAALMSTRPASTPEEIAAAQPGVIIEMQAGEIRLVGGVSSDATADEATRVAQAVFADADVVDAQIVDESFPVPEELVFRLSAADLFSYNSDDINPAFLPVIDQLAIRLVDTESWVVTVTGHTDHSGPAAGNQRLSERRAQAGANRLISQGVDGARVTVFGAGEDQPIASNETEEGRLANRRIEFVVSER